MRRKWLPLAWYNLTYNPKRLGLFCAGITFAVVLMFIQYGCRNALLDSSVMLLSKLRTDLVIASKQQTTILLPSTFSRTILQRAQSINGVRAVHPVYLEFSRSLLHGTVARKDINTNAVTDKPEQTIRVVGVDLDAHLLDIDLLDPHSTDNLIGELRRPGKALFDRQARSGDRPGESVYGPVEAGTITDLAGQQIEIVGLFDLGIDFGCDGTLVVSLETFARSLRPVGSVGMEQIDIGLVRLDESLSPEARRLVQEELQRLLIDNEVDVFTKEEYLDHQKEFWRSSSPIGYVFGFGTAMGAMVGVVICFQILSSNIRDNLKAYATLRAIGYTRGYLRAVVFQESLLLAVFGFVPGWLISSILYNRLAEWTGLPLEMTPFRIAILFIFTVCMCVGSGFFAVRQAQQADPAEVF